MFNPIKHYQDLLQQSIRQQQGKLSEKISTLPNKILQQAIKQRQEQLSERISSEQNSEPTTNSVSRFFQKIGHFFESAFSDENAVKDEDCLVFRVNGIKFRMIPVEAGTFQMGMTDEQLTDRNRSFYINRDDRMHTETVGNFCIGETEVTQELWVEVMGYNPVTIWPNEDNPVYCVRWEECYSFCDELNRITGQQFRLPTSAEWEYAARGGQKSKHYRYAGSDDPEDVVSGTVKGNVRFPSAVALARPNELGLYDMCGNVWEWCSDVREDEHQPWETWEQQCRTIRRAIIRGGSCYEPEEDNTISSSGLRITDNTLDFVGFRLAL